MNSSETQGEFCIFFPKKNVMMHENQQAEILRAMVMVVGSKKKERTIKGNWCNPAKDPPTIKSIFSLERKDGKKVNDRTYLK